MATKRSSYLQHLPATFQEDPFIGQFLLAFERILSGIPASDPRDPITEQVGLEDYIDHLHDYFDPAQTPEEFLPWLARWVAWNLREDWHADLQRQFISNIVPLYRQRGTKSGLRKLLEIYTGERVKIYEFDEPLYYFQVEMTLSDPSPSSLQQTEEIARKVLDQEKPAHTFYNLKVLLPMMQIRNDYDWPIEDENDSGIGLRLGWNTLLGTTTKLS